MAYSKVWLAMSPEEQKLKRKEYRDRYNEKHPKKVKAWGEAYKERNKEKLRVKSTKWQREKCRLNKLKAIEYKGGVCQDCNQSFPPCCYDFHHLDPTEKDSTVARIMGREFKKIIPELDKCVLLCSNCHRIRHFDEEI